MAPAPTRKNDDPKVDSEIVKSDEPAAAPSLYAIAYEGLVELHTDETAEARVTALTYGSKQHRKEAADAETDVPEGGGTHEINRDNMRVFKLNTSEVTDF